MNTQRLETDNSINLKTTLRRYRLQLFALTVTAVFIPLLVACLILGNFVVKPHTIFLLKDAGIAFYNNLNSWLIALSFIISLFISAFIYTLLCYERFSRGFSVLIKMYNENFQLDQTSAPIDPILTTYAEDTAGQIAKLLYSLKQNMLNYRNNLVNQIRNTENLTREISLAKEIQQKLLPHHFTEFQQKYPDISLYADLIPAAEVGGDLYEFCMIDQNHLLIAIGDVCGKGIPGSLNMLRVITILRTIIHASKNTPSHYLTPAKLLTEINNLLMQSDNNYNFITMVVGILNVKTGKLIYSNAGHNPPIYIRKQAAIYLNEVSQKPLGIKADTHYLEYELQLSEQEGFFIYTDGLIELMNKTQQFFGEDRLLNLVNQNEYSRANVVINSILKNAKKFSENTKPHDDITVMAVLWKPANRVDDKSIEEIDNHKDFFEYPLTQTLICRNYLSEISLAQKSLHVFLKENGIPSAIIHELELCLEEILTNIILHGYGEDTPGSTTIHLELKNRDIFLTFIDQGPAFNPCEFIVDDLGRQRRQRGAKGGHGIYLVRKLVNKMDYQRIEQSNYLTLQKTL